MKNTFKVPIRNIFYLLSYANQLPEMVESLNEVDDELITYDFLVDQFHEEVQQIMKRGVIRNYIATTKETNRLSGRLLINESIPAMMWGRPVVICELDEYTGNIIFNQVMRTTLEMIVNHPHISENRRHKKFLIMG